MPDPQAATLTQLRNIQDKTGERRTLLMEQLKLGYGDVNAVALFYGKPLPALGPGALSAPPAAAEGDPLDAIYSDAKAGLRPLHEAVMAFDERLKVQPPRAACAGQRRASGRPGRST